MSLFGRWYVFSFSPLSVSLFLLFTMVVPVINCRCKERSARAAPCATTRT
jgi:hypothetical protein